MNVVKWNRVQEFLYYKICLVKISAKMVRAVWLQYSHMFTHQCCQGQLCYVPGWDMTAVMVAKSIKPALWCCTCLYENLLQSHLPIGQKECSIICWTNQRGCKKNVVQWKFEMQYFQSLIIIGLTNEHFKILTNQWWC